MGARVGRKVQRRGRNRPLASRSQEKRTGPLRAAKKDTNDLEGYGLLWCIDSHKQERRDFFSLSLLLLHRRLSFPFPSAESLAQSVVYKHIRELFFLGVFNFFPLFLFSSVYSSRLRAHRPPPMPSFPCSLLYPPASRFPAMAENSVSA